jgi:hypothetical protein
MFNPFGTEIAPNVLDAIATHDPKVNKGVAQAVTRQLLPGEVIESIAAAKRGGVPAAVVLTDRRFLFVWHGMKSGAADIPMSQVTKVEWKDAIYDTLKVHGQGNKIKALLTSRGAVPFVQALRGRTL